MYRKRSRQLAEDGATRADAFLGDGRGVRLGGGRINVGFGCAWETEPYLLVRSARRLELSRTLLPSLTRLVSSPRRLPPLPPPPPHV